ncbi:MAG: PAS domain S-box protein [Myxococcales bacterium]|nr:PAS domain S-box protein [Myxococcales bacterium]
MAGISKGALYLTEPEGQLALQHQIGFSPGEDQRLRVAFGCQALFAELALRGNVVLLPSEDVPSAIAQQLLVEAGTTALLVVPVGWGTRNFGAILLGARIEDIGGEDALAFARVLGAQMGQAIGLSRSFESLAASELRYRTLTENANDAIVLVSLDGIIRESNRRCSEILGYSAEELVGRAVWDLALPGREPEIIELFKEQVLAGAGRARPVELRCRDGRSAMMEFSSAPVNIEGETILLTIGRDVTEQMQAQTQLMVSDRMASIGSLAAGVAHEINNPLAAVTINLELGVNAVTRMAVEDGASPQMVELQESLGEALYAADRVKQIVKDLKIFSRTEEDTLRAVDLEGVMESTLRMAWNEIRHRAKLVKHYEHVPRVDANESRLGQTFLNLIINAAQAIPEGHVDRNEITITISTDERGDVVTEIRDTGPGISPEIFQKLFTPFFTTKAPGEGTGLGLTICRRIITDLGGEITATSVVGEGTVFRVVLRSAQREEKDEVPLPFARAARRRGRVLLLDDDPMIGAAVRRALMNEHDVVPLTSAREALNRIVTGEQFDVILCDVMMPHMTGVEFHRELGRVFPNQADRIVFLTGGAFTATARVFLDGVSNTLIEKPFQVRDLRALVNERVC